MSYDNKNKIVNQCTTRIAALHKYVKARAEIPIDGKTLTATGLIERYQRTVEAYATAESKRAEARLAIAERRLVDAERRAADRGLQNWVAATFGANSQEAHDFGFTPTKRRAVSPEKKAIAAAKTRATRKARHTMGKRQKADIKGVVDQPIVLPSDHSITTPPANTNGAPAPTNGASVVRTGT